MLQPDASISPVHDESGMPGLRRNAEIMRGNAGELEVPGWLRILFRL